MEPANTVRSSSAELVAFFLLTFGISWGLWSLPIVEASGLFSNPLSPTVTRLLGAFGPSVSAVILAAADGRRALARLLGRFRRWRVRPRWYAVALFLPAGVSLTVTGVSILLGQPVPDFSNPPVRELYPLPPEAANLGLGILFPIVFLQTLLLSSPMGEEIGWRGYALPRLQADRSALWASVVLGVVWGIWHLPLFFVPGDPLQNSLLSALLVAIVADSILFSWLFNNTDGSLLLVLLFHSSIIVTDLFLSASGGIPFLDAAISWMIALVVLAAYGRETLTKGDSA
jgi:membrane protease YdiL (CAAX protease family)